ncbi:MAG: signal peptidase II [Buchnera aphidicola (Eriosoma harunire)]
MKHDTIVNKKYFTLSLLIYLLDAYTKYWIINHYQLHECRYILPILNIVYIRNHGIAFNLFNDDNINHYTLYIISATSMIYIIYMILNIYKKKYNHYGYSFIISGGLGNLLNRLYYGFVIDFIDIHINNWHMAVFNIADISIILGIIFILIN